MFKCPHVYKSFFYCGVILSEIISINESQFSNLAVLLHEILNIFSEINNNNLKNLTETHLASAWM